MPGHYLFFMIYCFLVYLFLTLHQVQFFLHLNKQSLPALLQSFCLQIIYLKTVPPICRPLVLLCDEPTGNLDPDLSIQIVSLLEKINRAGTTILMATHDSSIVNRRKKRVLELSDGKLIRDESEGTYV